MSRITQQSNRFSQHGRSPRRIIGALIAAGIALTAATVTAATVIHDFSVPPAGTAYVVGDQINTPPATMEFTAFQWSNGQWFAGGVATIVASNLANGSLANNPDQELMLNNIMLRTIPDLPASRAGFRYADLGGNVNLGVNGIHANAANLLDLDGTQLGGCDIAVTQVAIPGGVRGVVVITPLPGITIEKFGVGGQEFFVDDVTYQW